MKCVKAQELFSAYLEKTIQPPMGVAFEQHLAECARCKSEYEKFHATTVVLDELPQVAPPPEMHAAIMARIQEARRESPRKVNWLRFEWPSVFTLRVPSRALAAGIAMLLVFAMTYQLTPLQSVTANLFGFNKHTERLADDSGVAPMPMPWGVTAAGAKRADVGGGLMMGLSVNTTNPESTAFILRLAARDGHSIPVRVSLMGDDALQNGASSNDPNSVLFMGTVAVGRQAAVPVVMAGCANRMVQVAKVTWQNGDRSYSEYVFMPWTLGSESGDARVSIDNAAGSQILSKLSAEYGVAVIASEAQVAKSMTVDVSAGTADEALVAAAQQMGLSREKLGSSVYILK